MVAIKISSAENIDVIGGKPRGAARQPVSKTAYMRLIWKAVFSMKLLGSSNCARETYLVRVKRTYSVANLNATCVIYYMRANEIEGIFSFFD